MASFFWKYCSIGNACKAWTKDDHFSKEIAPNEGSAAASKPSPKSPLDVDFDKEAGVTLGLGLVPYLANLWLEDPFDRRIVFGINRGVDNYSRSLIRDSVANTYELITLNLNSPPRLFSCPSTPSSLFSPISHTALMGSLPDLWNLPDNPHELPFDPHYFLFLRDECHKEDDPSFDSDVVNPIDFDTDDELVLSKSHSSEQIYVGSFDGMQAQKVSHLAHEKEYTGATIACGADPKPTDHITYDDNIRFTDKPRRSFVGGLSATFGVRTNRPVTQLQDQYPTNETVMCCDLCKKPLSMEHNDSFKIKHSCSCSKQCKKVEVDNDEDRKKAFTMAPK